MTRLDIASWLKESGEIDGLPALETAFELDWGTELEGTIEFEDIAELGSCIEVGERAELGAKIALENHVELDTDTVLGYDAGDEALVELEMGEEVRDPPIPGPKTDNCAEAVLRNMLDWDTVGTL
jgi:hypothetical protein